MGGGSLSGGGLSNCDVNPLSNFDGNGNTLQQHFGDIVANSITANDGYFKNLDLNQRTLNISAGFKPVSGSDFEQCDILIQSNGTTSWKRAYVLSNNHSDLGLHVFVTADTTS